MVAKVPPATQNPKWCPSCGAKLVGGECVECVRPRSMRGARLKVASVRGYDQPADETKEPGVDARRASSEWLTQPGDDAPSTRKAHPTQVRQALAEAEVKARQSAEIRVASLQLSRPTTRPQAGHPARPETRKSTSPRVQARTPVPEPSPQIEVGPAEVAAAPPHALGEATSPAPAVQPPAQPVSVEVRAQASPPPLAPSTHPRLAAVGGAPLADAGVALGPRFWIAAVVVVVVASAIAIAVH